MNILRAIPAYRKLEAKNKHLTISLTKLENENQRLSLGLSELQAVVNKPKPRHLIFFHLLRTGGSSAWKALGEAAARQGLPVCDLYHQARLVYGNNTAIHPAMYDFQQFVRGHDCLIHHHIPYCLGPYFDSSISYSTIIRDPVDRFISEVNHVRHILTGDMDSIHKGGHLSPAEEVRGLGWPQDLIDTTMDTSVDFSEVLSRAAQYPHFSRYYMVWFNRLLNEDVSKKPYDNSLVDQIDTQALAGQIRAAFNYIGSFKKLAHSIQDIAGCYGLTGVDTTQWINKRGSDMVASELRSSLKPAFAGDYELIQALSLDV
jgi:hypothetical protein